jgi:hypothetical protein
MKIPITIFLLAFGFISFASAEVVRPSGATATKSTGKVIPKTSVELKNQFNCIDQLDLGLVDPIKDFDVFAQSSTGHDGIVRSAQDGPKYFFSIDVTKGVFIVDANQAKFYPLNGAARARLNAATTQAQDYCNKKENFNEGFCFPHTNPKEIEAQFILKDSLPNSEITLKGRAIKLDGPAYPWIDINRKDKDFDPNIAVTLEGSDANPMRAEAVMNPVIVKGLSRTVEKIQSWEGTAGSEFASQKTASEGKVSSQLNKLLCSCNSTGTPEIVAAVDGLLNDSVVKKYLKKLVCPTK